MSFSRIASAELFWPPNRPHRIAFTELTPGRLPPVVQAELPALSELAELADTIRSNGSSAVAEAARDRSASLLHELAEELPGPEAEVVALRAAALADGDAAAAARRQAEIVERDLVLLCGPVATWRRKSTETFHGMMASVPLPDWNDFVNRADAILEPLVAYVADVLEQPELTARPVPGFQVADLVVCGGEPSGFPKHFAYFLPEDEGVRGDCAKTVVYANVYVAHHELIGRELAARVLDPHVADFSDEPLAPILLWFRGHDIGHQLRLPQTALRELHVVGREASIALQEALADTIGYLVAAGGPWPAEGLSGDREEVGSTFLAELLRYLQRGPQLFPDSDAAFLELGYLAEGGYVELDERHGTLAWDPDALHDGMVALARELTEALLDTDVGRTNRLIEAHLPVESERLADWWSAFDAATSDVPTTFAYSARSRAPADRVLTKEA